MAWRKPKPDSPTLEQLLTAREALNAQLAVLREAPGVHFEDMAERLRAMLDEVEVMIAQLPGSSSAD